MLHCDPRFCELLNERPVGDLEAFGSTIYGAWPDLTLAYFNPAWLRFAAENHGEPEISQRWGLGCHIPDAISEPLKSYYQEAWAACLREGRLWEHDYECSSADVYRLLHMTTYPISDARGLLVVSAMVVERPHDAADRPPHAADDAAYCDAEGSIHQCMHCRKVERLGVPNRWDWVPAWVERSPAQTTHTLCPICLDYHYPEPRPGAS